MPNQKMTNGSFQTSYMEPACNGENMLKTDTAHPKHYALPYDGFGCKEADYIILYLLVSLIYVSVACSKSSKNNSHFFAALLICRKPVSGQDGAHHRGKANCVNC